MRIVLQKVKQASVTVDSQVVSSIEKGLLLLVGISTEDTEKEVEKLSTKIATFRVFEDEAGSMWKKSVQDLRLPVLSVSQFTLLARTKKGTKPDLHKAAKGEHARALYDLFLQQLRSKIGQENVQDGIFGAMMDVSLVNDGPITITFDSDE